MKKLIIIGLFIILSSAKTQLAALDGNGINRLREFKIAALRASEDIIDQGVKNRIYALIDTAETADDLLAILDELGRAERHQRIDEERF